MKVIFYDTETSGLPLFSEPSEDPRQPHIVQLAALVVDVDTRETIADMDVIVRPDGWEIPDDVAAIHGITTARAMDEGVAENEALSRFLSLWKPEGARESLLRVGHNEQFDARIVRIGLMRFRGELVADDWKAGKAECTQRLATPIMKLPPTARMKAARRFHHKSASLAEAHEFFLSEQFDNAHSAMADARAAMLVWFAIRDRVQPVGDAVFN